MGLGYSLFLLSFNGTNIRDFITRQTYVVITCFWRDMGYIAFTRFCRESGFVTNTRHSGLFCPDFYSDIEDFT